MGMCWVAKLTSDERIERCLNDAREAYRWLFDEEPPPQRLPRKRGWLSRLLLREVEKAEPATLPLQPPLQLRDGEGEEFDVDKAWQVLHWLLTGSAEAVGGPFDMLLNVGEPLTDRGVYLEATVHRHAAVQQAAQQLRSTTDDDLRSRYAVKAMRRARVYKAELISDEADQIEWVLANAAELRRGLDDAAGRGFGIVARFG